MHYTNGDFYVGGWELNKRCGHGELKHATGQGRVGDWVDDKRLVKGKFLYPEDNEEGLKWFFGTHTNGFKHGQGSLRY